MEQNQDMCSCGWVGDDFPTHHEETQFEDNVHVETSPLMKLVLKT